MNKLDLYKIRLPSDLISNIIYYLPYIEFHDKLIITDIVRKKWYKKQLVIVYENNVLKYLVNGIYHSDDVDSNGLLKPALVKQNVEQWYWKGRLHRDDVDSNGLTLPAEISSIASKWYRHGRLYRDDVDSNGDFMYADIIISDKLDIKHRYINGKKNE